MGWVRAVVFDMDGTLLLLKVRWGDAMDKVRKVLGVEGRFLRLVRELWGSDRFRVFSSVVEEFELEAAENPHVYPGAVEAVARVSERFDIGFVTMQGRRAALKALERAGLLGYAKVIIARDDAPLRILQLVEAFRALGVSPLQGVVVADKVNDVCSAIAIGAQPIMVVHGRFSPAVSDTDDLAEDLEALGVPIVRSLAEVPRVVERLAADGPELVTRVISPWLRAAPRQRWL